MGWWLKSSCPPGEGKAKSFYHEVTKPCLVRSNQTMPCLPLLRAVSGQCRSQGCCLDTAEVDPDSSRNWNSTRSGASPELCTGGEVSQACRTETMAKQSRSSGLGGKPQRAGGGYLGSCLGVCTEEREVEVKRLALPGLLWWMDGGEPSQGCEVRLVRAKMLGHAQQAHKQQDECMYESACMSHVHRHSAVVTQPTAWLAEPLKRNHTRTNILCACLIHKAWAKWFAHTVLRCTLLIPLVPRKCYWLQMVTERIAQSSPYVQKPAGWA